MGYVSLQYTDPILVAHEGGRFSHALVLRVMWAGTPSATVYTIGGQALLVSEEGTRWVRDNDSVETRAFLAALALSR